MQSWLSSMRSKPATWLLHIALGTIVLGACVTHFFGVQGEIHLRADKAETLTVNPFNRTHSLSLFLWDFQVVYDASDNPVDFVSDLRLLDRGKSQSANDKSQITVDEGTVQMNKPLKYHGFRFCQSDYDSDLQGVVFSYNYDPWGIGITYAGYALLLLGMLVFFFQRHSRFRALLNQSVFRQHSGLYAVSAVVLIIVLAVIMTRVVTPKPPLEPVLQTPLLGIHVSVIMLSYTLFAIMMVNGILGIYAVIAQKKATGLRKEKLSTFNFQLSTVSQILLYPAVFCLAAGIFIGAVWANLSWGRYWGWDPKETWALITLLVYALLLHWPWIKKYSAVSRQHSDILYHVLCVVAFLFVLFTYFGVSYLLGGLHSYA